ncbi:epoxide hydrolase [Fusarium albosuccineum]|uniref:Epoxide hydrolase n=1 Tax=Fusarium albosuccineum TaxID=1237068 RepID=A0A8H4LBZ5_9HYPO|nr:epoxide hydrolase [Fusarium albosuccineum]
MHFRTWPLVAAFMAAPAVICHESGYPGLNFHFPNTTSPKRFEIQVNQDFIDLTLRKVRDYRPSPSLFSNWTIEGPPEWAMTSLADYWAKRYQWRATEKRINQFDHYATTVAGSRNYSAPIPLHFIHQRSNNSDDTPLLLLHGWTSTHFEWSRVIRPLTQNGNKAFHVVVPDLPGYGFSPAPTESSMGPREMGAALDGLMKQLGYETYGIVSTDLGWALGMWMAADFPDSLTGMFTDFYRVPPLPSDISRQTVSQTTKEENEYIEVSNAWDGSHSAYATAQIQKPQALSLALTDSPVGFAGWLWDLRHAISDGYPYTHSELITAALLLWIQSPYSSMRSWLEFYKVRITTQHDSRPGVGV